MEKWPDDLPKNDCYYCKHGNLGDGRCFFTNFSQNPCSECQKNDDHKLFEERKD